MGRVKEPITFDKAEKAIKEGRGQGEGIAYNAWIRFQDLSSRGTATRYIGRKVARIHHVLSQLELLWLIWLEFQTWVIDIREQYPLLYERRTLQIADCLGIKHPAYRGKPIVMTTDFLATCQEGPRTILRAYSVKYVRELKSRRVREKLLVEQRFWESLGVKWRLLTNQKLPRNYVRNLIFANTYHLSNIAPNIINAVAYALTKRITNEYRPLREVAEACDAEFDLAEGTALDVAKYLIATKHWQINLHKPIITARPLILQGFQ
jgi:hypothetical protein